MQPPQRGGGHAIFGSGVSQSLLRIYPLAHRNRFEKLPFPLTSLAACSLGKARRALLVKVTITMSSGDCRLGVCVCGFEAAYILHKCQQIILSARRRTPKT